MNIRRRAVVELPSLLSAPAIIANSELLTTLPERAITTLFSLEALKCFKVPFSVSPYILNVYYHNDRSVTPGHIWMRKFIHEAMNALIPVKAN